uniref:Uncharacterized protein n=1 Tax=Romanomermis culicivorax TaxID=13658 RepID=A0A915IEL9_ROMCU
MDVVDFLDDLNKDKTENRAQIRHLINRSNFQLIQRLISLWQRKGQNHQKTSYFYLSTTDLNRTARITKG